MTSRFRDPAKMVTTWGRSSFKLGYNTLTSPLFIGEYYNIIVLGREESLEI